MGAAYFYHLTRSSLEETLAVLSRRALEQGWRVAIRSDDPAEAEALDRALWLGAPDDFLPHGLAGGEHDALQPILLTAAPDLPAGTDCLMVVGAAATDAAEVAALARVCVLFDGDDPAAVERARGLWRSLTGAGAQAQYWSQAEGRWQKKAESG